MSRPPIHPATTKAISAFRAMPSHAVIIEGPAGADKYAIAKQLASELLVSDIDNIEEHPYLIFVQPEEKQSIGIDQIRGLLSQLSLIVPAETAVNRVIIIRNAEAMTTEAQNAILKALEEPPEGTVIMLLTDQDTLLPTIKSRAQKIRVQPPSTDTLEDYFVTQGYSSAKIQQALAITGGIPRLTSEVLADDEHAQLIAADRAKEILGQSAYQRLTKIDELTKDSALLNNTLNMLIQIAEFSIGHGSQDPDRWQNILESVSQTKQDLANNAQPKLALTSLMLSI